jgi:hypothetical protein
MKDRRKTSPSSILAIIIITPLALWTLGALRLVLRALVEQ